MKEKLIALIPGIKRILEENKRLRSDFDILKQQYVDLCETAGEDIDNFRDIAKHWVMTAIKKEVNDILNNRSAEAIYEVLKPMDEYGMQLFEICCKLLHCSNFYISFPEDDRQGVFDQMDGFDMVHYLEQHRFANGILPLNSKEYKAYRMELFKETIQRLDDYSGASLSELETAYKKIVQMKAKVKPKDVKIPALGDDAHE